MMHTAPRRWPITATVTFCLAMGALALSLIGGHDEPNKDDITNSIGMKLKLIKPGKFLMGSPEDAKDRFDDEGPQHPVEITQPFHMAVFAVTRGQFAAFVKDDGYQTEAEKAGDENTWRNPGFVVRYVQTDDDPVVQMSWNDTVAFCAWLSRKEKKNYGLPTEAEWEYACRAGTTTAYFFGDDPKGLVDYAWYGHNAQDHTHPVGGKKPNPWGLYDMHGNVWQRCADRYGAYQKVSIKDPKNTNGGEDCVNRGGSWTNNALYCRSAYRIASPPAHHSFNLGFRVVLRSAAEAP